MVWHCVGDCQYSFGGIILRFMMDDSYKTIACPTEEILYKDRKSKFYGYAFPITSEEEIKPILEDLRKRQPSAGHVCYAWQLGVQSLRYRANDDGEPKNSAGMPIYGQIKAFGLTNVLVAVSRIYGGTKLGVGGLIQAYRTTAQLALEASKIIEKHIEVKFMIQFEYPQMDKVMRCIKQLDLTIELQKMELSCEVVVSTKRSNSEKVMDAFNELHEIALKKMID